MVMNEVQMDLMQIPRGWAIAHCISGDMALGAGVAKQIEEKYNMRQQLKACFCCGYQSLAVGTAYLVMDVFNLVTKEQYWHKPTLASLRQSLESMAKVCKTCGIKHLAMPRIGCGLDRMDWTDVKPMIADVFKDVDIEIKICYL